MRKVSPEGAVFRKPLTDSFFATPTSEECQLAPINWRKGDDGKYCQREYMDEATSTKDKDFHAAHGARPGEIPGVDAALYSRIDGSSLLIWGEQILTCGCLIITCCFMSYSRRQRVKEIAFLQFRGGSCLFFIQQNVAQHKITTNIFIQYILDFH